MRLQSLSWLLATAVFITACGNDSSDNVTVSSGGQFSSLPTITPETPNPVSIAEGEILNGFAVVDDEKNDRWLVADTVQGIIAVDKTTDARTVLIPLASESNDSIVYSIQDIALDTNGSTLYIIDDVGAPTTDASIETPGNLVSVDLNTGNAAIAMPFNDMIAENGFKSREPNALFFDEKNDRLLIGDARGISYNLIINGELTTALAFAVFTFDTTSETPFGVLAAEANSASPILPTLDVRDFHFDADSNTLYVSAFNQFGSLAGEFTLESRLINVTTWEQEILYSENPAQVTQLGQSQLDARQGIRRSIFTGITFDNSSNQLYVYNPFGRIILEFELDNIGDSAFGTADGNRIQNSNTEERSLRSVSQLTLSEAGILEAFDSELRGFFTIDIEDNNQSNLIFAGTPITDSPLESPQIPRALGFNNGALVVSDNATNQLNLLTRQGDGYEALELNISLETPDTQESIIGTSVTLEEGQTNTLPLSPKPLFLAKNRQGDTFFFAEGFQQKTDDALEINTFPAAIYRMQSGSNSAYPTTTTASNDGEEVDILDINTFYSSIYFAIFNRSRTFSSGRLIDFAASNDVVYIAESDFLFGWNERERLFVQLAPSASAIRPTNIVGIAADEDNDRILIMDSGLDALIAISEDLGEDNSRTVEFISSTEKTPFTPIPAGLAFDADNNLAYTYENSLRAVIQIDVATGERKRIDSNPNFIRSVSNLTISDDGNTLYLIERISRRVISLDIATGAQTWLD